MCGIAGLLAYRPGAPDPSDSELALISAWQRQRGPDDHATWRSPDRRCLFDHRRLAIIDLSSGGRQPMLSDDGALAITFNGEIYNYVELRRQLQQQGHVFRSSSDTEVILHLYRRHGASAVAMLRGMFALAIWDQSKRGMLLARDPFGIKPLYYSDDGGTVRFASTARALLAGKAVARDTAPAAQVGFLLLGSVPEPFTWWRQINALPAGSTVWIDEHGLGQPVSYVDIAGLLKSDAPAPDGDFLQSFAQSVRYHMVADVPVGVFLSSGVDSVAIAEQARAATSQPLTTLTVGFDVYRGTAEDETVLAAQVAQLLGTQHRQQEIGIDDFRDHRQAVMDAMDQPTIDGVNTYFVSLAAKRAGLKVALSGVGGDEMLGGYPSFRQIPLLVAAVSRVPKAALLGRGLRAALAPVVGRMTSPKYAGVLEYGGDFTDAYLLRRGLFMPWELPQFMDRAAAAEGLDRLRPLFDDVRRQIAGMSPYVAVTWLETSLYLRNQLLRDTDWASMAHSLEIRTPFVDVDFLRQIAPQLRSRTPPSKARLVAGMPEPLRRLVENRPKRGFQVPIREWMQRAGQEKGRMRGWRGWALDVVEAFGGAGVS